MIEEKGNEPNLRYGFIPENIYQNLKFQDFSIRLDAAQILNKSVMSLSQLTISELSKDNVISFFEFSKQFLVDENFGVINNFNEIIDYFFENIDKCILRENLNIIVNMLLPPLQDKRYAVRSISSNLIIKYSTVLKSTDLLEQFISFFYDQPVSSQIEILNVVGKYLSVSDISLDDNFNQKVVGLIENSFLIVNVNVRSASTRLLRQIQQSYPEIFKSIPEEIQKAAENENNSTVTASRIPRTPTSSLPPIYMSFNSNAIKQKISQAQQQNQKAPDTASSKKRSDEFWYRSKPRFAKTAGFIIGKSGMVTLQPASSQQFASTSKIPIISQNHIVRTPDANFQPHEPYSPLVTDESPFYTNSNQIDQVHVYDQVYSSIDEYNYKNKESKVSNDNKEEESEEENNEIVDEKYNQDEKNQFNYNQDEKNQFNYNQDEENQFNYNQKEKNQFNYNQDEENQFNYNQKENEEEELNDTNIDNEEEVNYTSINQNNYNNNENENDHRSIEFDEFDSMPVPRVAATNKKKFNRASLINMNEQTGLGMDDKQIDESFKDSHINNDDQDLNARPFQRNRRQFKPRPPSLPPSTTPSLFAKCADVINVFSSNADNSCDDQQQNQEVALNIKKLSYKPSGASFRAKKQAQISTTTKTKSSTKGSKTTNSKPDLQSLIADLQCSSDWEKQNAALLRLQSFVSNSPSFVSTNVRVLSFEVVPLCSSIRSALSKTALECLTSIASSFGNEMTPFFESIVNDLLTILLSSRGFITRLASGCISTILHNVSRKRAIEYLTGDHKKRPGSCKATLSMCLGEILCEDGDENAEVSVEVIKSIGSFITDANPDARKHARDALKKLASKNPNLALSVSNMQIEESTKKVIIDAIQK